MTETRAYEDLIGAATDEYGADFFSSEEFALREAMEHGHYWHLHRRQVVLEELLRAGVARSSSLIEIGCGIGTVATYLNGHGYRVDYADVHGAALEVARRVAERELGNTSRRFVRLDVTKTPLEARYDGVLMLDVLEHLPDDVAALTNVCKGLPSGGVVLFTVPAFKLLWSPWDDIEHHKRRYTLSQAKGLATDAGLSVKRATYFFFPLFFAALGVKALRGARSFFENGERGAAQNISEMAETKTSPLLNRLALGTLALENPVRRASKLALGTSVLCVAEKP
ncbi:MAG: class I SAM-dependent methyltransferase [Myxococcales bacterium]|nr:class I SAM-dependent methyltransferase [Myxococcales bacterium]MCB9579723.1 class I SAM-dependent methyltransferase [Polyangiaceae bacterium]